MDVVSAVLVAILLGIGLIVIIPLFVDEDTGPPRWFVRYVIMILSIIFIVIGVILWAVIELVNFVTGSDIR